MISFTFVIDSILSCLCMSLFFFAYVTAKYLFSTFVQILDTDTKSLLSGYLYPCGVHTASSLMLISRELQRLVLRLLDDEVISAADYNVILLLSRGCL